MPEPLTPREFLDLVAAMRLAQSTYFRDGDLVSLSVAKELEALVDRALAEARDDRPRPTLGDPT